MEALVALIPVLAPLLVQFLTNVTKSAASSAGKDVPAKATFPLAYAIAVGLQVALNAYLGVQAGPVDVAAGAAVNAGLAVASDQALKVYPVPLPSLPSIKVFGSAGK